MKFKTENLYLIQLQELDKFEIIGNGRELFPVGADSYIIHYFSVSDTIDKVTERTTSHTHHAKLQQMSAFLMK